MFIFATDLL